MRRTSFKVSIVIPNWNGKELLKKNLPQVLAAVGTYEIIVVDDCSDDGSADFLQVYKQIKLIKNTFRCGFAASVNKGVAAASGDIVVLLNTDVVPARDFLTYLLPHFNNEQVFAVGCMDRSHENGQIVLRGRGLGGWQHGFWQHRRGEVDKTDTDWVSGGSGAFRKSIWQKLGGMDEIYNPFYWEDIDLSYRAKKAGYSLVFEPHSIVDHFHQSGGIKTAFKPDYIKKISYRNQILFVWNNLTSWSLSIRHFLYLLYHIFRAILKRDMAFIFGFMAACKLISQVALSRRRNRISDLKSDWEL
ncbi:hypothetical protein A2154_00860 [Candidatus Gottesmanbacteria bacterium RBG_16_43_7]|uniref:Glycosyltransferase 2-like domain-containing protein n=1 Tax=Candidatus Gottesmanbacteria bacterium RBG_16_43_7 TaxID=1798373 RepID=A0A1F5Z7J1_9BACT|nr:MAG: hypothetical protein A2154_00860 [Candidatus Gottesmanbacteria bacterium RBG_16_43_7]